MLRYPMAVLAALFLICAMPGVGFTTAAYAHGGDSGDSGDDGGPGGPGDPGGEGDEADAGDDPDDGDDMEETMTETAKYCEYPLAWLFPPTYVWFCHDYQFPAGWEFPR